MIISSKFDVSSTSMLSFGKRKLPYLKLVKPVTCRQIEIVVKFKDRTHYPFPLSGSVVCVPGQNPSEAEIQDMVNTVDKVPHTFRIKESRVWSRCIVY
jgi:hypothetical protein